MQIGPKTPLPRNPPSAPPPPNGMVRIPFRYYQSMPSPWYEIINHSRSCPASFMIPLHKKNRPSTCSRNSCPSPTPFPGSFISDWNWMFIAHFICSAVGSTDWVSSWSAITKFLLLLLEGFFLWVITESRFTRFDPHFSQKWNNVWLLGTAQRKSHELIIS